MTTLAAMNGSSRSSSSWQEPGQVTVPIASIDRGYRTQRDLGDLGPLRECIASGGLLNPVTISEGGALILGARRLAACQQLEWDKIPATRVATVPSAVERMEADAPHTCCARPLTPREAVAVDDALRTLEWWPRDGSATAERRRRGWHVGRRELIAGLLGMNTRQYRQARTLVLAAAGHQEQGGRLYPIPAAARDLAAKLLAGVESPGDLNPAFSQFRGLAADEVPLLPRERRSPARPQSETLQASLAALAGLAQGLGQVSAIEPGVPPGTLDQWEQCLSEAIRGLQRLKRVIQGAP